MKSRHAGRALMEQRKKFRLLNSYSFGTDKGEVYVNVGSICFANVRDELSKVEGDINQFYLAVSHKYDWYFKKYLKFIITKSFFKDCFLTKRLCDATQYGLSMDVTKPLNQMQAGLIAARRGYEFPSKTRAWYDFVKAGVSPNLALIVSYFVQEQDGGYELALYGWASNHEVFGMSSFEHAFQALFFPLKEITKPICEQKSFKMNVFKTVEHDIPNFELDWYVLGPKKNYVQTLDFNGTVEKLKKIQKEYNV